MSLVAGSVSAGLPARSSALEPEWVRKGSPALQKQYAAALQFEQMLVAQLAGALTQNGELGGAGGEEGGAGGEPGASIYSSMLPQALASGVVNGGGLGLAAQLTGELAGPGTGAPAPAGHRSRGGTAPDSAATGGTSA
jgi:hypothetical protein